LPAPENWNGRFHGNAAGGFAGAMLFQMSRLSAALSKWGVLGQFNKLRLIEALTASDLFARVIAARSPGLGGFDALAVDHPRAGRGFLPLDFAQVHDQKRVDRLEQTSIAPGVEIPPDCGNQRKAFGQQSPRASGVGQI